MSFEPLHTAYQSIDSRHRPTDAYGLLAFDIETEPDQELIDALPEPEVKVGNLTDPEKIAAKQADARAAQKEKAALDPNYGRTISCHFAYRDMEDRTVKAFSLVRGHDEVEPYGAVRDEAGYVDVAERELLLAIGDIIQKSAKITTFNGANFDVPFLRRRALYLRAKFPYVETNPFRVCMGSSDHIDVCRVLQDSEPGRGGNPMNMPRRLRDYAKRMLAVDHPEEFADKLAYSEWFRKGDFAPLCAAGEWDAAMTFFLAELCFAYY